MQKLNIRVFHRCPGNFKVHDYGDLQFEVDPIPTEAPEYRKIKNYGEFMGCNKALIRKVQELLQENDQFLTIGGDHAIGFGKREAPVFQNALKKLK